MELLRCGATAPLRSITQTCSDQSLNSQIIVLFERWTVVTYPNYHVVPSPPVCRHRIHGRSYTSSSRRRKRDPAHPSPGTATEPLPCLHPIASTPPTPGQIDPATNPPGSDAHRALPLAAIGKRWTLYSQIINCISHRAAESVLYSVHDLSIWESVCLIWSRRGCAIIKLPPGFVIASRGTLCVPENRKGQNLEDITSVVFDFPSMPSLSNSPSEINLSFATQ